jgi:transglutaminase/protease-like cytokinesis protein 3
MAKKAASPKKLDSKKTPNKSKVAAKPAVKAKPVAKAPTAKVAKPTPKIELKPKKDAVVPKLKPATMSVAATAKVSKVTAMKAVSSKQVADSTEKIKIDRDSMSDEQVKWAEMYNKHKETQASSYDMRATFQAGIPIQHKVLGWGWVVSNDNDRLEVLFKDGKRMLISNYRG